MFRIISPNTDPTPTYVADTVDDLKEIKRQQFDSNVQGIAAIVLHDTNGVEVYMLDFAGEWIKL